MKLFHKLIIIRFSEKRFPGIINPDCSLYVDAPLCVQIADIYLNRAVGFFLKEQGILDALVEKGIEDGDTVRMYGHEFDYYK